MARGNGALWVLAAILAAQTALFVAAHPIALPQMPYAAYSPSGSADGGIDLPVNNNYTNYRNCLPGNDNCVIEVCDDGGLSTASWLAQKLWMRIWDSMENSITPYPDHRTTQQRDEEDYQRLLRQKSNEVALDRSRLDYLDKNRQIGPCRKSAVKLPAT